jgi:hypothetical protein
MKTTYYILKWYENNGLDFRKHIVFLFNSVIIITMFIFIIMLTYRDKIRISVRMENALFGRCRNLIF